MTGYPRARAYTLSDGSLLASANVDYPTILPPRPSSIGILTPRYICR